ncbi:hypothetical protein FACS1894218_2340 [Bacilli bacterium]|nr:hypothetical protein FACS1894218_2340 [Bacilli bacterium]
MVSIADEVINSWHDGKMEKQGFDFNSKDNTFSLESPGSDMALTNIKFHTIENDDQCDPA